MSGEKENCEDGSCGTENDWPNCSKGCVCACHDFAYERLMEAADNLAKASVSGSGYVNAAKKFIELRKQIGIESSSA